jgi:hypothetical protein
VVNVVPGFINDSVEDHSCCTKFGEYRNILDSSKHNNVKCNDFLRFNRIIRSFLKRSVKSNEFTSCLTICQSGSMPLSLSQPKWKVPSTLGFRYNMVMIYSRTFLNVSRYILIHTWFSIQYGYDIQSNISQRVPIYSHWERMNLFLSKNKFTTLRLQSDLDRKTSSRIPSFHWNNWPRVLWPGLY